MVHVLSREQRKQRKRGAVADFLPTSDIPLSDAPKTPHECFHAEKLP
jgi:hypothetical protein